MTSRHFKRMRFSEKTVRYDDFNTKQFRDQGLSVTLAAGDTFRAAAMEQLQIWGERSGVPVIARETGTDSAGLAFDALTDAKGRGDDVLIVDTAGHLQNKDALMDELAKVVRVLGKVDGTAKGGVVVALAERFGLPVHYIGVGEGVDDLRPVTAVDFAKGLLDVS